MLVADKKYGTIDDLKSLISKAHELGIKIIMDFVPNHTSDQHDWFLKSVEKTVANGTDYTDFYIWRDAPNNWVCIFFPFSVVLFVFVNMLV